MDFLKFKNNKKYKGRTPGEKLVNPNVNQYRLTKKQRIFYTELFNENSTNGKVKRENFFPLLGILGTQISHEFSDRMFSVLSKGQPEITLDEYLSYIDTYYYGDIHERCLYTCKLMDIHQQRKIDFEDFKSYINLIINAVRKVNNPLSKKDLMSEQDIKFLFLYISKGQPYFTYDDFENIYREKPELVSWFDYFKNDKEDILLIINDNILVLAGEIYEFLCGFMNDLFVLLDKEKEINIELIFANVLKYNNKIEKIISNFIEKISKFKITSVFSTTKTQKLQKIKLIYDLQNKVFEKKYNENRKNSVDDNKNINELFNNVKKTLYKLEENEILLNNKENELDIPNKDNNLLAEKLLKRSKAFRDKNFKFNDIKNLRESKISHMNKSIDFNKSVDNLKIVNINVNRPIKDSKIINNLNHTPIKNYQTNFNLNNAQNLYINNNLNININNYNLNNNINQSYNDNQNIYNKFPENQQKENFQNININYSNYPFKNNDTFHSLKESQKLKLLLFFSRVVIEKALEANIIFNNCYKWISENYLAKSINKIKKEEKMRKNKTLRRKNSRVNKHRKLVPLKKKIIGASEKSFEILLNMIMGIQIAVQAIPNFKIKNEEDIKKYLTKMIYSIQTIYLGKEKEESYYLKEFGGVIFNNIRIYFGISKDNFIKSISPQDFITELMISSQTIFEELCSTGSSGSLLYYTRDGEFIVKTISKKEYKFLKTMISKYYFYMKDNPLSFLPKLYGCYILKRKYKKKVTNIYFIVMANVFVTTRNIDVRFDLKGSRIGRQVINDKNPNKLYNGDMALKDLDFERYGEKVYVGNKKREIILEQFKKDIEFLYQINSNDYSLLLGIHMVKEGEKLDIFKSISIKTNEDKKEKEKDDWQIYSLFSNTYETNSKSKDDNTEFLRETINKNDKFKLLYDFDDFGILSENRKRIYYFGIIDILTEYGTAKHFEHFFKKIIYCSNEMSCIPPQNYMQRFYNYLNIVFAKADINNKEETSLFDKFNNNNLGYSYSVEKSNYINTTGTFENQGDEQKKNIDNSLNKLK